MARMDTQVTINGVTITQLSGPRYVYKWKVKSSYGNAIWTASLEISKTVDSVVVPTIGQRVTIKRGTSSPIDEFIFDGEIVSIEEKGFSYVIGCYDQLYKAVKAEITYSFDKAVDSEAGQGSALFKTLINDYTDIFTDDSVIVATGTADAEKLDKFICRHEDVFDKCKELCRIYGYQIWFDPDTQFVHFEPRGYDTTGQTYTVGGNVTNLPQWSNDATDLVNDVTILGATQDVETTENGRLDVTSGWTSGNGGIGTLSYKPESVKVYADSSNPPTTLRKGGVEGATDSYDYTIDKENKTLIWNTGNGYAWNANHYVKAELTHKIPVPLSSLNYDSIIKYGRTKKTFSPKQVMTVNDAELEMTQILTRYSTPFKFTELHVVGETGIRPGQTVTVVDATNDVDDTFVITEVEYLYPYKYDKIVVGDRPFKTGDFEVDVLREIREIKQLIAGETEFVVHNVPLSHQPEPVKTLFQVWKLDTTGDDRLIFDDDRTLGDYNTGKFGRFANEAPFFDFEEGSGTNVQCKAGSGYYGTVSNATFETGHVGSYAIRINADNENIKLSGDVMNGLRAFSVAFWYKLADETLTYNTILSGVDSNGDRQVWIEYQPSVNRWFMHLDSTYSNSNVYITDSTVEDNAWHHIVIIRDPFNDKMTVYIDNSSSASSTLHDVPLNIDVNGLYIGQYQNGVGTFETSRHANGDIDDFRIYPVVLSSADVAALYNSGSGLTTPLEGWSQHYSTTYP